MNTGGTAGKIVVGVDGSKQLRKNEPTRAERQSAACGPGRMSWAECPHSAKPMPELRGRLYLRLFHRPL
jgi:hypothetical protein